MATRDLRSGYEEEHRRRRKHRHRTTEQDEYRSSQRRKDELRDVESDSEGVVIRTNHRQRHRTDEHRPRRHRGHTDRRDAPASGRSRRPGYAASDIVTRRRDPAPAVLRPSPSTSTISTRTSIDTPPRHTIRRSTKLPFRHERQSDSSQTESSSRQEVDLSKSKSKSRQIPGVRHVPARVLPPASMVRTRSNIGSVTTDSEEDSPSDDVKIIVETPATTPGSTKRPAASLRHATRPLDQSPERQRRHSKQDTSFLSLLVPGMHQPSSSRRSVAAVRPKLPPKNSSDMDSRISQPQPPPSSSKRSVSGYTAPAYVRRKTTPSVLSAPPKAPSQAMSPRSPPLPPPPEEMVECLTCCDEVPKSQSAKLQCEHIMCNTCLKRIFNLSITDPQHMPPKCCTEKNIPLEFVAPLFDDKFKRLWNKKYAEFTTKDRMYCPKKGCGEWIKPKEIRLDRSVGRRYGVCSKCNTKACKKCNMKWHGGKDCKNDEETKQLLDTAKKEGWQRCYSCKAVVQLSEGCNHMKCRCTAEFCMICGSKWKTCDCPWFNTPPDVDMPFPGIAGIFPPPALFRPRIHIGRDRAGPPGLHGVAPVGFAAEQDARRAQERDDARMARRIALEEIGTGDPLDMLLNQNFAMNAIHMIALGAHDDVLQPIQLEPIQIEPIQLEPLQLEPVQRRPPLRRREAARGSWVRPRQDDAARERRRELPLRTPAAPTPPPPLHVGSAADEDEELSWFDRAIVPRDAYRRHREQEEWTSASSTNGARRPRERMGRRATIDQVGRPSIAALAGLAGGSRTSRRDRVGGWLEHVAGGPPERSVWDYEVQ